MRVGKKIIRLIAVAVIGQSLLLAHPVQAFVWPAIDLTNISSFGSTLSSGVKQVMNAKAEIDNYVKNIHAIGDQISTVAKFAADLKKAIESLKEMINKISMSLINSVFDVDKMMKGLKDEVKKSHKEKSQIADSVSENVSQNVEDDDQEGALDALSAGEEETKEKDKKINELLDQAEQSVKDLAKQSDETLDMLNNSLTENANLDEERQKELQQKIADLKQKMNNYQNHSLEIIQKMREKYNESSAEILEAYAKYRQDINDYFAGKITKEELEERSNAFKETIKNSDANIDEQELANLAQEGEELVNEIEKLQEEVLDLIANNKDYSDEDEPDKTSAWMVPKPINYVFNFHSEHSSAYLKGCYAKKNDCKIYPNIKGDASFLLSKELTATGKTRTGKGKDCQDLKFSDIDDGKQNDFLDKLRDCVIRAKVEKDYFCPDMNEDDIIAGKCDPYNQKKNGEDNFNHKKMKENGVYSHIIQDYNGANIVNSNKMKQYSRSWLDADDKNSKIRDFHTQFENPDSTRSGYGIIALVDVEAIELWSRLRRLESVSRAKKIMDAYKNTERLYLDGRDTKLEGENNKIFMDAQKANPGLYEYSKDGNTKEANIISNMFLYLCDENLKGEDISVDAADKNDKTKKEKAEENITKCIKQYAEGATNGTINGGEPVTVTVLTVGANGQRVPKEVEDSPDIAKVRWRTNQTKAVTDSQFHTFALSTINLYKSSKDHAKVKKPEINVQSLYEQANESKDARNDYGLGGKINNYATQQLLSIVDAEAQALQSEIIRDLPTISYDFFPDMVVKKE